MRHIEDRSERRYRRFWGTQQRGQFSNHRRGAEQVLPYSAQIERYPTLRDALVRAATAPWEAASASSAVVPAATATDRRPSGRSRTSPSRSSAGEVVGIIGRNGAGKEHAAEDPLAGSRNPTTGRVDLRGRVGQPAGGRHRLSPGADRPREHLPERRDPGDDAGARSPANSTRSWRSPRSRSSSTRR